MRARTTKRDVRRACRFSIGHPTARVCVCPTGHSSTSRRSSQPPISSWGRRLRGTRSSTTYRNTTSARRHRSPRASRSRHGCPSSDPAARSSLPAMTPLMFRGAALTGRCSHVSIFRARHPEEQEGDSRSRDQRKGGAPQVEGQCHREHHEEHKKHPRKRPEKRPVVRPLFWPHARVIPPRRSVSVDGSATARPTRNSRWRTAPLPLLRRSGNGSARCGCMKVWRYDPAKDAPPTSADPTELNQRRAVFLAASDDASVPCAWIAVDDYDGSEGTVLFAAPPGEDYRAYVSALLVAAVEEARSTGFTTLLAHWRAGWSAAEAELLESGFAAAAPGTWRCAL